MSTQPPEQNPNDYDEVTRLRLQLNHAEVQRDAFAAALKADVLKVIRVSIIQATIDADEEIARLKSEVDGLSAQLVELDDLKAEADQLKADIRMEKENEDRLVREWQKANNEVYGLQRQVAALIDNQTRLKAEVENFNEYLKWHADGHKFAAWQVWRSQQSDGGQAKGVQS